MFGFTRYNYDRFRREMLQGHTTDRWSRAPEPGDEAPDFQLRSLSGDLVKLSDFKDSRNVVVTFGSATCPQTAASIGGLRSLSREFPLSEVEFLFIYVREAHPGAELPPHHSIADKARAAMLLREQEEIEFPILIDELGGETHRKYGALPNASFIVDKSGRIAYRSLASHGGSLGAALEELLERQKERDVQHAIVHGGEDTVSPSLQTFLNAYRAIERGGYDAVQNFRGELGFPGRVVLRGGRMARPMREHPAITITTVVGVAAAVGLGIWAGYELRKRRFARRPYDAYRKFEKRRADEDDYSAVGI
ncbi:MAG TPA: deiodinase-like protein [Candidatus Saccharimonadales bacterium]|nr:deiodinase-like protein [Candidatus Saccharimonadales bacterium]